MNKIGQMMLDKLNKLPVDVKQINYGIQVSVPGKPKLNYYYTTGKLNVMQHSTNENTITTKEMSPKEFFEYLEINNYTF